MSDQTPTSIERCSTQTGRHTKLQGNQSRILVVLLISSVMMVVELVFGYWTGSMSLLADGWHMVSHVGAMFIAYAAYALARSTELAKRFTFGTGKFIPLGGYTSAIALAIVALLMVVESVRRLWHPSAILFDDALIVTGIGLAVNITCAVILGGGSFEHGETDSGDRHTPLPTDHNLKSAYYHVLSDALTSILAIVALSVGKYTSEPRIDALIGVVGGLIILRWAYSLCLDTGWELLDGHAKSVSQQALNDCLSNEAGVRVDGLHVWQIGPHVTACEVVITADSARGPKYYKDLLKARFGLQHLVVEERVVGPNSLQR